MDESTQSFETETPAEQLGQPFGTESIGGGDELAVNLGGVDTTPILPTAGLKTFICTDIKVEPNKKKDGNNLVIKARFAQPEIGVNGKPLPEKYETTHWASLKQVFDEAGQPKNNPMRSVAIIAESIVGKPLPQTFSLRDLMATGIGQTFQATLKHETDQAAGVVRASIGSWIPKKVGV